MMKTWLTAESHFLIRDTLFARLICSSRHQLPILFVASVLSPESLSHSCGSDIPKDQTPQRTAYPNIWYVLVRHRDSVLGSMSRCNNSSKMSFAIHVSLSWSSLNIQLSAHIMLLKWYSSSSSPPNAILHPMAFHFLSNFQNTYLANFPQNQSLHTALPQAP